MKNLPTFAEKPERWDFKNTLDFAEMKGKEKGVEKVAREMLKDNVPIDTIVKYSGLTPEQIATLGRGAD